MKLCSACLLGVKCAYDGKARQNIKIIELSKKEVLIPVCPEQLGGLPTPRESSEIVCNDSKAKKIVTESGNDVTQQFRKGAEEVLRIAKLLNIESAVLKQRSPSCGCGQVYDGTFSGTTVEGDGITTALLKKKGIKVISEEEL